MIKPEVGHFYKIIHGDGYMRPFTHEPIIVQCMKTNDGSSFVGKSPLDKTHNWFYTFSEIVEEIIKPKRKGTLIGGVSVQ